MNPSDNRRIGDRVCIQGNVYVVLNTQPQMMGQMVEISSKGLAFTFVDLEAASERLDAHQHLKVDLFTGGRGYFIRNLPCRIVSNTDKAVPGSASGMMIRRVGVAFEKLSLSQQVQINAFVRHHMPREHEDGCFCANTPLYSL